MLCDAFGRRPDAAVHVSPWHQPPEVFRNRRPYRIRPSARDTYWCQYAYQFSRELCHVLANFDRIRHHRHNWFEESICELAALFVLHRLSEEFRHGSPPDVLGAAEFAPHFATYADKVAGCASPVPPAELPRWLSEHLPALEADCADRDLNRVVAVALLDSFLKDPLPWRDCGMLNRWDASADPTFADHLDSWARCLRARGMVPRAPRAVRRLLLAHWGSPED